MVPPTLVMPPPRRRWGQVTLLVVGLSVLGCLVAGVTAAVVSSALKGSGAGPATGPGGGTRGSTAAPTVPASPGLGDPVRDGQFEFVVAGLACGETELVNGILRAQAQGQYCLVELSVRNVGDQPRHFADGFQKAYGPDGDQYAADSHAGVVVNGSGAAIFNVINPGNAVRAKIVFDIPPGATIAALELHDAPLSGGVRVVVTTG